MGFTKHLLFYFLVLCTYKVVISEARNSTDDTRHNDTVLTRTELSHDPPCKLQISQKSVINFTNRIVYEKASAFTLLLNLTNLKPAINYNWTTGIILPFQWIWVNQETLAFLGMPRAATVWSLGLLGLYYRNPVGIQFEIANGSSASCEGLELEIGNAASDQMMGNAFGQMTMGLALKDPRYNMSHWCYMKKVGARENKLFRTLYNNFFSVSPVLQYVCCKYDLDMDTEMHVKCSQFQHYDSVWWDVPLGVGILMLLYFPLLFMKVSGKIHNAIEKSTAKNKEQGVRNNAHVQEDGPVTQPHDETDSKSIDSIYLDSKSPITAGLLLKSLALKLIPRKQSHFSRLMIFLYLLLTLLIPGLEVLTYNCFLYDYAMSLANNNISFGFSSILAGWEKSKESKFSIFGGPIIAIIAYLITGWILLLSPKVLANQVYHGVCERNDNTKSILCISLTKKEFLGSVEIKKHRNGYIRLSKLQLCHLYMFINPDFWIFAGTVMKGRFCSFASFLKTHISISVIRYTILVVCFPLYAIVSSIELVLAVVYYVFPMSSFIVHCSVGFTLGISKYISVRISPLFPRRGLLFRGPAFIIVAMLLIYHLYIFTVLFLDSFFFISRILLFTYTAVVAYPRETYGYFMLTLLSAYFCLRDFLHFGDIYKQILKHTIKICREDEGLREYIVLKQDIDSNEVYGVPKELFEYLVDKIRPLRVNIFHTSIRLCSMIFILSVSIVLLQRFEKFEDISLLAHVFVTLFISALPTIYRSVVSKKNQKYKMIKKIKRYLQRWMLIQKQPTNYLGTNCSIELY